jgi:hypothetical protein
MADVTTYNRRAFWITLLPIINCKSDDTFLLAYLLYWAHALQSYERKKRFGPTQWIAGCLVLGWQASTYHNRQQNYNNYASDELSGVVSQNKSEPRWVSKLYIWCSAQDLS